MHMMAATYFQTPELALSDTEAKALGDSIARVQEFYPDVVMRPEIAAWTALAVTALRVELPRAQLLARAIKEGKHKRKHHRADANAPAA